MALAAVAAAPLWCSSSAIFLGKGPSSRTNKRSSLPFFAIEIFWGPPFGQQWLFCGWRVAIFCLTKLTSRADIPAIFNWRTKYQKSNQFMINCSCFDFFGKIWKDQSEFYLVPKMANFEANFKWDTLVFFHSLIWSLSMINLGWFSLRCSVTRVILKKKSSNEKYFKKQTNLANRIAPTLDFFCLSLFDVN